MSEVVRASMVPESLSRRAMPSVAPVRAPSARAKIAFVAEEVGKRAKKPSGAAKKDDVALVIGATPDGETLGVLRKRGERVEPALVRRAVEGQPIQGELIRMKPREEPLLYDVDVVYDPSEASDDEGDADGPAQVANPRYRKGWDRVFKKKRRVLN